MRTAVVNLRRKASVVEGPISRSWNVYIGRKTSCPRGFTGEGSDGIFGNPFPVTNHGPAALARVLAKYRAYFLERVEDDAEFRRRVLALRGKVLACFCKPNPCHGDVIAAWVDSQFVGGVA